MSKINSYDTFVFKNLSEEELVELHDHGCNFNSIPLDALDEREALYGRIDALRAVYEAALDAIQILGRSKERDVLYEALARFQVLDRAAEGEA